MNENEVSILFRIPTYDYMKICRYVMAILKKFQIYECRNIDNHLGIDFNSKTNMGLLFWIISYVNMKTPLI